MAVVNRANPLQQWHEAQLEIQQLKARLLQEQEASADTRSDLVDHQTALTASEHRVTVLEDTKTALKDRLLQETAAKNVLKEQLRAAEKAKNEQADQAELHRQTCIDLRRDLSVRNERILQITRERDAIIRIKNRDIQIRNLVIAILQLKLKMAEEETDKAYVYCTTVGLESMVSPFWGVATIVTLAGIKAINGNLDNQKQSEWRQQKQQYQNTLDFIKRQPI